MVDCWRNNDTDFKFVVNDQDQTDRSYSYLVCITSIAALEEKKLNYQNVQIVKGVRRNHFPGFAEHRLRTRCKDFRSRFLEPSQNPFQVISGSKNQFVEPRAWVREPQFRFDFLRFSAFLEPTKWFLEHIVKQKQENNKKVLFYLSSDPQSLVMESEHPPDPRTQEAKCREVDHQNYIRLWAKDSDYFLVNEFSGETVALDTEDGKASLHFSNARAFVVVTPGCKAEKEHEKKKTLWVASLMRSSVWSVGSGRQFVFFRHNDGGHTRRWRSELQSLKDMIQMPVGNTATPVQLHVWVFKTCAASEKERFGRVFFELCSVLPAFRRELQEKALSKQWRESWKNMLEKRGFHPGHWMVPYCSKTGKERSDSGMVTEKYCVSVWAVLHFLVHLTRRHANFTDISAFLNVFLTAFIEEGTLSIDASSQELELKKQAESVTCSKRQLQRATQGWKQQGWKVPRQAVTGNDNDELSLIELVSVLEASKSSDKLYMSICMAGEGFQQLSSKGFEPATWSIDRLRLIWRRLPLQLKKPAGALGLRPMHLNIWSSTSER